MVNIGKLMDLSKSSLMVPSFIKISESMETLLKVSNMTVSSIPLMLLTNKERK